MATFKSVLSVIGADAKKVFAWVGGPGAAVITSGEAIVEAVDPGLTGIINLANTYLAEVLKTEALATAAGAQSGTGMQKSAAVVAAVTPAVVAYAQAAGLPAPTAAEITAAANGIVAFLNALNAAK